MTPISLQDRSEDSKMTHLAVQSSATSGCAREARCLRGSIPPRAPRAPKGRRCRGRRCPPLGTSRSPVARDGGEGMGVVQSVGGAAGGRIWKGRAGEGRRGHGVVFHCASPQLRACRAVHGLLAFLQAVLNETVGAIPADGCKGATFGAISPSGHSCNSCNSSPPTVQQLQQLPADSGTF